MFGQLRKEDSEYRKTQLMSLSAPVSCQKPSPTSTSSDDQTKGDNFHDGGTGTNSSRYARKKSGLKPIRPANISASNLLNPTTPGKLPQTPRLNFKENDHSRFGIHDFPSTPKFGRSESTPELHRMKKMDHLLHTNERSSALEKTHSNVLQESNVSNLLTITSDSLPDIFRKPIIQQQPDVALSLQSKAVHFEDKVSKWGYGPSSNNTQSGMASSKPLQNEPCLETTSKVLGEESFSLKTVKEESPVALPNSVNSQLNSIKDCHVLSNEPEKFSYSRLVSVPYELQESALNKCPNKSESTYSTASGTSNALSVSTQSTRKMHPLDLPQTPLAKKLDWTGHSITAIKVQEPSLPTSTSSKTEIVSHAQILSNTCIPSSKLNSVAPHRSNEVEVSKPVQTEPIRPTVSTADIQIPFLNQGREEPQKKVAAPVTSNNNFFPPPNSRPPTKTKQISVNGKLFTVMKPLGRGGSSVVYQVLNPEMTDVYALKVVRLDSVDEVTAEGYINEVRLLKQLQGLPRVVRLLEYEYNEEEEKLLLVMERGDTDFATVIRNRTSLNGVNPILIRFYWQEMLEAVGEIHAKNVIHTDLKPANFLLVNGGLKLIDFGIATSIQADMTSIMKDSQCGTYNYMAPEAIKSASPVGANQEYKISRKTDVWSLGCMLYSLIYKNPPFNKFRDTIEKISAIVDERHIIDFPATADPMVISVLKSCLDRNPRNRPSIDQLLSHPYLTCTNPSSVQPFKTVPDQLRIQLDSFMEGGKLTEEAKEIIRQWM